MTPRFNIEWQATEYHHQPRDESWFRLVIVIGALGAFIVFLLGNFLFAVILLVGTFSLIMYTAKPPEEIAFALTPRGVKVGEQFYPYQQLNSFWLDEENNQQNIIFGSKRLFYPHLIVPLAPQTAEEKIRLYLESFLPEIKHEHSLIDALADIFGRL